MDLHSFQGWILQPFNRPAPQSKFDFDLCKPHGQLKLAICSTKVSHMSDRITLLGTGLMGLPMARNIHAAGFRLSVWNRSTSKTAPLRALGIPVADDPAGACVGADIIITMLSDGPAVMQVAGQVLNHTVPKTGAIWIDMSSTQPAQARDLQQRLRAHGLNALDAPVSGGSQGASDGTLAIMVGGSASVFDRAAPILESMGSPVLVGPNGAGQLAKLANQAIVGITIAAVAEATLLLEKGGANANAVRAALAGGFADSIILQQHGARMSDRNFIPGGTSQTQLKDLDNVLAEAGDMDLPLVRQVRDRFARYVHMLGGGERDHSGLFEELCDLNRLP